MKLPADDPRTRLVRALWRIYYRPETPRSWTDGGNLPWNDPDFSERMLREHLDETHGAASRTTAERELQLHWLWEQLALQPGDQLLDVTCGPGLYAVPLAERGLSVTGIDFSPASIAYARQLASERNVADRCTFVEQDIREMVFAGPGFDAAILLYGQLAVFPPTETQVILDNIGRFLKPGGRLCLELLNPAKIDKANSRWWFTDDSGLWGDGPFLHLGERFWNESEATSTERYYIVHLETGMMDEIHLSDRAYTAAEMTIMLRQAGFGRVDLYPAWSVESTLYDADEWLVYIAQRSAD